jgi:hypothetical protein
MWQSMPLVSATWKVVIRNIKGKGQSRQKNQKDLNFKKQAKCGGTCCNLSYAEGISRRIKD